MEQPKTHMPDEFQSPLKRPNASRPMTPERLEELLQLTIANQKAEGICMSEAEIVETRKRLFHTYGLK